MARGAAALLLAPHLGAHSAAYREHAARLVRALAEHARNHPALAMWHVDNEYACHVSECFLAPHLGAPIRRLRFASGSHDGTARLINGTTPGAPRSGASSTAIGAPRLGARNNAAAPRANLYQSHAALGLAAVLLRLVARMLRRTARHSCAASRRKRSLKEEQAWMLMEQAPAHVNWRQRNATKPPGVMRLGSYQALARGANGILFFQWRASHAGSEKFHSGMVPHTGTDTRVWREVKTLGAELHQLSSQKSDLLAARVPAEVAILFDWDNWWALELEGKPLNDLRLFEQVKKRYTEFYRRHITVDFARPDAALSKYRLVLAPHLYLVSDESVRNLEHYVAHGGTLVMNFMSGIVDPQEHIRLGGYPAPFRHLFGLWIEEFVVYGEHQANEVETVDGKMFTSSLWSDVIHPTGAQVLGTYRRDFIAQSPAITRNAYDKGASYYIGTELNPAGLEWILERACAEANVQPIANASPHVELTTRTDGKSMWLFALNHGEQAAQLQVPEPALELLRSVTVNGTLLLEPRGIAILQFPTSSSMLA